MYLNGTVTTKFVSREVILVSRELLIAERGTHSTKALLTSAKVGATNRIEMYKLAHAMRTWVSSVSSGIRYLQNDCFT